MRVKISRDADIRGLARALIYQAILDLTKAGDPRKQIDALVWLIGPDFPLWAEAIDSPFLNPYKLLPNLKAARKTISTRRIPT